jgi:hypothetical protein
MLSRKVQRFACGVGELHSPQMMNGSQVSALTRLAIYAKREFQMLTYVHTCLFLQNLNSLDVIDFFKFLGRCKGLHIERKGIAQHAIFDSAGRWGVLPGECPSVDSIRK